MPTRALDHVNVVVESLPATIAFYEDYLDMRAAPSPGMQDMSRGCWLYDGSGAPVLHLIGSGGFNPFESDPAPGASTGSGRINHIAFQCDDYAGMRSRLENGGVSLRFNEVTSVGLRQIFAYDPNGIMLELNFR